MQRSLQRFWFIIALSSVALFGLVAPTAANASSQAQTPDARARAIVAQMTLDEKILEVHGVGGVSPNLRIVPAIPRLGIPAFVITNGSAGVSYGTLSPRAPATALPAPLALAASWDTKLANAYGSVIGNEAKILGNDMLEGPDMNWHVCHKMGARSRIWGRIHIWQVISLQMKFRVFRARARLLRPSTT